MFLGAFATAPGHRKPRAGDWLYRTLRVCQGCRRLGQLRKKLTTVDGEVPGYPGGVLFDHEPRDASQDAGWAHPPPRKCSAVRSRSLTRLGSQWIAWGPGWAQVARRRNSWPRCPTMWRPS